MSEVRPKDFVKWKEPVFTGSFRNPKYAGERTNSGTVVSHSYESGTGHHWLTVLIDTSEGVDPLPSGKKVRRRGKNVYGGLLEHVVDPLRERETPPPPGGKFLAQRTCTRCAGPGANAEGLCKPCLERYLAGG